MIRKVTLKSVQHEIEQIRKRYPAFKDDTAFVFWFLYAHLVGNEDESKKCLTGKEGGRGGEKNIDAIYIDNKNAQCSIIQGKYHYTDDVGEKRNDVLCFAGLSKLPWADKRQLDVFYNKLDPIAASKFKELINCVKNKKYSLHLYYVTTGKCTKTIIDEAKRETRQAEGQVEIAVYTIHNVLNIYRHYLDDIIPHIPPLRLRIVSEGTIRHEGAIHRFDPQTNIESWVFSISGSDVGKMFDKVGNNLFAKNIRGYLGSSTDINDSIAETIKKEPHNFWYYNNGVTIVCDDAQRIEGEGNEELVVEGAQVINGQQTTRTLSGRDASKTNVLVKVIKIPRIEAREDEYDKLINSIVRATNWQNYISPADLVSNDYIQLFLERELRKRGYQYIRKKMSKSEAKSLYGQGFYQLNKKELSQAVAGCFYDPAVMRKGWQMLFEDPYYKTIFGSKNIAFYLSKYLLTRQVKSIAYGDRRRAYSRWLVVYFAWLKMERYIGSGSAEKKFRYAIEQNVDKVTKPFNKTITNIFRAAISFYNYTNTESEEKKDIAEFFKVSNLHKDFLIFWRSHKNPYRSKAESALKEFSRALSLLEIGE